MGSLGTWTYRCYVMVANSSGWRALNCIWEVSPDIPYIFIWPNFGDKEGLKTYVDALLNGHRAQASEYESKGFVTGVEMKHSVHADVPSIKVNIGRLVDFLLMRDHMDVPLWGKVGFLCNNGRIVPREIIGALMKLAPEYREVFNPDKKWEKLTEKKLREMGLRPEDVTSGMYREEVKALETKVKAQQKEQQRTIPVMVRGSEEAQPQEIRISLKKHDEYFDLLTQVLPEGEKPYYTRRIAKNDGTLLWCGTAYDTNGPWTVWQRESAELMALGIDL